MKIKILILFVLTLALNSCVYIDSTGTPIVGYSVQSYGNPYYSGYGYPANYGRYSRWDYGYYGDCHPRYYGRYCR